MTSPEIKLKMRGAGVPTWKVAEKMGVCEMTLYRMLRKELPQEKQDQIMKIIDEYQKGSEKA